MKLTEEHLNLIFKEYLDNFVLPGSSKHLPIFASEERGAILTKRLKKILRARELSYLTTSTTYDIVGMSLLAQELLREKKKVYIYGLNHWFTIKDVEVIMSIVNKYFG